MPDIMGDSKMNVKYNRYPEGIYTLVVEGNRFLPDI